MVLGISSFTYGWAVGIEDAQRSLNEQDLVAQTRSFGLNCLQIGDNLPLHRMPSERLSQHFEMQFAKTISGWKLAPGDSQKIIFTDILKSRLLFNRRCFALSLMKIIMSPKSKP